MLRYSADIRSLIFVALYFVFTAGAWILFPSLSILGKAGAVILLCCWAFFCAVIIHNTIHCPIFRKKSWNKAFQVVLSFTYGHSVSAYVPGHNFSHHRHTQTKKDNIRTSKMRFRWNLLNQLLFFFRMSNDIALNEFRFAAKIRKDKPKWFNQYLLELILVIGTKIGLTIFNWQLALFLIWIPHLYAVWGIVSTNFWQHDGCDPDHEYNHSRTFTSKLLNWFTFNNGYHAAHHEKPGLHWSLLPAFHAEHLAPYTHPNLQRNSLFAFCWEYCIWPGKRVDYLGNPVVLPIEGPDHDWIEEVWETAHKNNVSFGAE